MAIKVLLLSVIYCLPALIAMWRSPRHMGWIVAVDLLAGWTIIGWLAALAMAIGLEGPGDLWASSPRLPAAAPLPPVVRAPGVAVVRSPLPAAAAEQLAHIAYTRQFLDDVIATDMVDRRLAGAYRLLAYREAALVPTPPAAPAPAAVRALAPSAPAVPPARPAAAQVLPPASPLPAPTVTAPVRTPGPAPAWAGQLERIRQAVVSEFSLHGLAYFGVLLTFSGVLGFTLFAYKTLPLGVRAVSGMAVPLFLFAAAWYLRRRNSVVVGACLEVLAAAVSPVVVFATTSNWLENRAALWAALSVLMSAGCFASWQRRPSSPLRFGVAPMLWVAVWSLGLLFRGGIYYSPEQVALTGFAIVATLAIARRRPTHPLAMATRTVAVPGIAVVFGLGALFVLSSGAAAGSSLATALATIAAIELLVPDRAHAVEIGVLQWTVLGLGLAAAAVHLSVDQVGLLAVLGYIALVEVQELRRPDWEALPAPLFGVAAGLLMATADPWSMMGAFAVATVWVHTRRIRRLPSLPMHANQAVEDATLLLAAALPLGVAAAIWQTQPAGLAIMVLSLAMLGAAIAVRLWRREDDFYAYWLPVAGRLTLVLAVAAASWSSDPAELACGAAVLGVAFLLAPRWPAVRLWSTAAAWSATVLLAMHALLVPATTQAVVIAAGGLAVVLVAAPLRARLAAHLSAIGLVIQLFPLFAAPEGWSRVTCLSAWVGSWLVVAVLAEIRRPSAVSLVESVLAGRDTGGWQGIVQATPAAVLAVSIAGLVMSAGNLAGIYADDAARGVALGVTAFGYAVAARITARRRPLAPVATLASLVLATIAIGAASSSVDASVLSVCGAIAGVVVAGPRLRHPLMTWFAWCLAFLQVALLARWLGLPDESLARVLVVFAALVLSAALQADDLIAGARKAGDWARVAWLLAPATLAAIVLPMALAFTLVGQPRGYGWWLVAVGVFYLLVAVQLRSGSVTAPAFALLAWGATALLPTSPLAQPDLFVPMAAALVLVAFTMERVRPAADGWHRWDIPPLAVAHVLAVLALGRSLDVGGIVPTWSGLAVLSLLVAGWRRQPVWLGAAIVIAIVAADHAGAGWLALVLLGTAAVMAALAERASGEVRVVHQGLALASAGAALFEATLWTNASIDEQAIVAAATGATIVILVALCRRHLSLATDWAWTLGAGATFGLLVALAIAGSGTAGSNELVVTSACLAVYACAVAWAVRPMGASWLSWVAAIAVLPVWPLLATWLQLSPQQGTGSYAVVAGGVALSACILYRAGMLQRGWEAPIAAATGTTLAASTVVLLSVVDGNPHPWVLVAAVGVGLYAVAIAGAASPMRVPVLREAGAALLFVACQLGVYDLQTTTSMQVAVELAIALGATVVTLGLWGSGTVSPWTRPLAVVAGLLTLCAAVPATAAWPGRALMISVLLVAAGESAAFSLPARRHAPLYGTLVMVCGAWLLYATEALDGNPNWVTVPVGLTILAAVELARWDLRAEDAEMPPELVVLEYSGMAFMVSAALFETIVDTTYFGLLAIVLGIVIVGWAAVTRVRRRLEVGAGTVGIALVLMLSIPVIRLLPQFRDAALWGAIVGIGLILLVAATTLEQSRASVRATVRRVNELTLGWE